MMTTFIIGGSLESHYRLLLAFCPKIWGGDRDLQMVLCDFMNAGSVVGIPWGGGTLNPYLMQKKLFELFALLGSGDAKTSGMSADTVAGAWAN